MSRRVGLRHITSGVAKVAAELYDVDITIELTTCTDTQDRVIIDGVEYAHGDTAKLTAGDHTLTWAQNCGLIFYEWEYDPEGNLSVADPEEESTTLTVSGSGSLGLGLWGGEQFGNGDFEQGDLTYWTATGDWEVTDSGPGTPYEGDYRAMMYKSGNNKTITGTLEQEFISPIAVACIADDCPTFAVATRWDGHCDWTITTWKIEILYSDDTVTELDISGDPRDEWVVHDLKSILEAGKSVKGIRITGTMYSEYDPRMEVDACTLDL